MIKGCPDTKVAMQLWEDAIKHHKEHYAFTKEDEYRFHTMGVGMSARLLATRISGLDPEKAFVLGLLHDYGKKYNEKAVGFHGLIGYLELTEMGYHMAARICLTHTFPNKDFDLKNFPSYPISDLEQCKSILDNVEYDDYDRIIQLCDLFFEGLQLTTLEKRIEGKRQRYNLGSDEVQLLTTEAYFLRDYFTNKIGDDVLKILGAVDL